MKKILSYLVLSLGLLFGLNAAVSNTTTAKADTTLPAGYDFAVTNTTNLLDNNGNQTATVLQAGTDWKVFGELYHGDETVYQVSPNGFVNENSGYLYQPKSQNVRVSSRIMARLYTSKGELLGERALGKGTLWYSDRTIVVDKVSYYRVSTDEWAMIGAVNPE